MERKILSKREAECLTLVWKEHLANQTIASRLGVSESSVKFYLDCARKKLEVSGRYATAKRAIELGEIA